MPTTGQDLTCKLSPVEVVEYVDRVNAAILEISKDMISRLDTPVDMDKVTNIKPPIEIRVDGSSTPEVLGIEIDFFLEK